MDMLHGPLSGKLLLFTLPIALSGIIQQLFNAADTSIVGYFDNAAALAAVGTNGEIVALIVTLSAGLSLGVNILVSGCIGRGGRRTFLWPPELPCSSPRCWAVRGLPPDSGRRSRCFGCTIVGVFVLFYGLSLFLRGRS